MTELINEAILPFINDGKMSMERIHRLIYIKEFVDRIAAKRYLREETLQDINSAYGVGPSVRTWGDYFQTELATTLQVVGDEEFRKAVDTVKFDMLASYTIFCEKESAFFEWVDMAYYEITLGDESEDALQSVSASYSQEEQEILHLKILKDYYTNLGIKPAFTPLEWQWFDTFEEAAAM